VLELGGSTTITVPLPSVPDGASVKVLGREPFDPVLVSVVYGPLKMLL
jgi:hypothetical protein